MTPTTDLYKSTRHLTDSFIWFMTRPVQASTQNSMPREGRRENGIVHVSSNCSVPESLERLQSVVKSRGLTVFARIDFIGDAAKAGLRMRPPQVLIFWQSQGRHTTPNVWENGLRVWEFVGTRLGHQIKTKPSVQPHALYQGELPAAKSRRKQRSDRALGSGPGVRPGKMYTHLYRQPYAPAEFAMPH